MRKTHAGMAQEAIMPFKKDDKGNLAMNENGFPIYVGPDGSEKPYDVDAKIKQIAELTEKASKLGSELDRLNVRYGALSEIEDIATYIEEHKKNAETVTSLADKAAWGRQDQVFRDGG